MSMSNALRVLAAIVTLVVVSGCAAAYHSYPGGCTAYDYCPEPPLPYTAYRKCHCPTPIAAELLREGVAAAHHADEALQSETGLLHQN